MDSTDSGWDPNSGREDNRESLRPFKAGTSCTAERLFKENFVSWRLDLIASGNWFTTTCYNKILWNSNYHRTAAFLRTHTRTVWDDISYRRPKQEWSVSWAPRAVTRAEGWTMTVDETPSHAGKQDISSLYITSATFNTERSTRSPQLPAIWLMRQLKYCCRYTPVCQAACAALHIDVTHISLSLYSSLSTFFIIYIYCY